MEDILFNDDGSGLSAASISTAHVYTAEEIALMLAALGAMVASIVYSFKHIKSSSCLGSKCQQEVVDVVHVENGRQETDV
tara:strand:- start:99 stop:338 length:240 start_codon:yes stop_codon:yes gene_type:complete